MAIWSGSVWINGGSNQGFTMNWVGVRPVGMNILGLSCPAVNNKLAFSKDGEILQYAVPLPGPEYLAFDFSVDLIGGGTRFEVGLQTF